MCGHLPFSTEYNSEVPGPQGADSPPSLLWNDDHSQKYFQWRKIFRYVMLPLNILTVYTVPDCRKPQYSNWSVLLLSCRRACDVWWGPGVEITINIGLTGQCLEWKVKLSFERRQDIAHFSISRIVGHNFYCGLMSINDVIIFTDLTRVKKTVLFSV